MYGAGKRNTRPPNLYSPTTPYQVNLPVSDFDITLNMSESDDENNDTNF